MHIAFDAKRAYHNSTGLGQYSRTLLNSLALYYSENAYSLYTPSKTDLFKAGDNFSINTPQGVKKLLKGYWRSRSVITDLLNNGVDLYHGLSNEIPIGISKSEIKSVVTIHDLIFERYPRHYKKLDIAIYRKKFRNAVRNADKVIAISNQTKQDLINYYNTPESKIEVCYQSCNPVFEKKLPHDTLNYVRDKFNLPQRYYLYVGSVTERKNLLALCKALTLLPKEDRIPLVIVGKGKQYLQKVKRFLKENSLTGNAIFLSESPYNIDDPYVRDIIDLPALYQMATALIYPSLFEGFGIPVLEALWSECPVITSNVSSMPEAGGNAALYVKPEAPEELAEAMQKVVTHNDLREEMITTGIKHANKFSTDKTSACVMNVYKKLLS